MLQEAVPLQGDDLWHAAAGFGGGFAGCGDACGALTGALMAMGFAEGQKAAREGRVSDRVKSRVRVYCDEFLARFGSVDCQVLSGYLLRDDEQYRAFKSGNTKRERCYRYVEFAIRRSLDLVERDDV